MSELVKSNRIVDMLLGGGGLTVDKLPMLPIIFERLAKSCSEGFADFGAPAAAVQLATFRSGRLGELIESSASNAVAGVFHATGWDCHVAVVLDRAFVFTMVEALFGSDGSEPAIEDERPFTTIERRIAAAVFEHAGRALQISFAPVSDTAFKLDRLETEMELDAIGRPNNPGFSVKLGLEALGRSGTMFVIIPQAALSPMRQALSRVVAADANAGDPIWSRQIESEVRKTTVSLRAVLEERSITLGEIAGLRVGQVLELQASARSRVRLESSEQPLFWCELGQAEGAYNLRVDDIFDHEQEFMNDLLSR